MLLTAWENGCVAWECEKSAECVRDDSLFLWTFNHIQTRDDVKFAVIPSGWGPQPLCKKHVDLLVSWKWMSR